MFSDLFTYTPSLEHLNMDRNPLLPLSLETFAGIELSLRNVSCQSCSLTSNSLVAFSPLRNLERLKLQSNFLTQIQPADLFVSMINLLSIDLQRNQLTDLPDHFPMSLRELELGNNRLTSLSLLNETMQLTTIDLSSNPLHCDCHIQPLYHWLFKHFQAELVPYVQWICSQPKELSGKQLGSLSIDQLRCEEIPSTTESIPLTTEEAMISSFNVWLKDPETAILEWSYVSASLKLIVYENGYRLPILYLNSSESYFLLEKLKSSTNYSLCLQMKEQHICRNLLTPIKSIGPLEQKILSLSSKSPEKHSLINDLQYLITGIACGILVVLLVLLFVVIFVIKQRAKLLHNSSKTIATDSFYQTTGSDTTQIGGSCSIEDQSSNGSTKPPMFFYCRSTPVSNCCQDQQPYHFYHEIPFTNSSTHLNPPSCFCRPPIII